MKVLCIEHLHEFDVRPNMTNFVCPECGCRYVRRSTGRAETVTVVTVLPGRHAIEGPATWLNDKREFARMAREVQSEMTEDEIKDAAARWHGDKEHKDV